MQGILIIILSLVLSESINHHRYHHYRYNYHHHYHHRYYLSLEILQNNKNVAAPADAEPELFDYKSAWDNLLEGTITLLSLVLVINYTTSTTKGIQSPDQGVDKSLSEMSSASPSKMGTTTLITITIVNTNTNTNNNKLYINLLLMILHIYQK